VSEKVILSWSGGKDGAMALHEVRRAGRLKVMALLTTVTDDFGRVSMHGVRRELVHRQAASLGLPLREVGIPAGSTDELYEQRMAAALEELASQGASGVIFGDIFLADVRKRREEKLAQVGMSAHFPLWRQDTAELARRFVACGFRAILTCVDTQALDGRFAGREYDLRLLEDLPSGVDPCGENGEFHSFVYDGPIFSRPIPVTPGQVVLRDNRFNFCDLLSADGATVSPSSRSTLGL
jgi:uncharacterized protein (TIGR00290 family)